MIGDMNSDLILPLGHHDSWWIDAVRVFCIAGAILLVVVHTRLAWNRWRRPHPGEVFTHPLTHVSYVALLIDIILRRLQYIDQHRPPDIFLVLSLIAVVTGLWGVVRRVTVRNPADPPHIRHRVD